MSDTPESLSPLFWHFMNSDKETSRVLISWFIKCVPEPLLSSEEILLREYLKMCYSYSLDVNKETINSFLDIDLRPLVYEKRIYPENNIEFGDYDDEAILTEAVNYFAEMLSVQFDLFSVFQIIEESDKDFLLTARAFLHARSYNAVSAQMLDMYTEFTKHQNVGLAINNAIQYFVSLKQELDLDSIKRLPIMLHNGDDVYSKASLITKTGINCIDADIGGIYSGMCLTIAGQPGSGKTRFAAIHGAYQAMMAGHGVLFDEVEMPEYKIRNILIAHHIVKMYDFKFKIPDSVLNRSEETWDGQVRSIYESAKRDLFESGKYGKFTYRQAPGLDTIAEDTLNFLVANPDCRLWVVDYVGAIAETIGVQRNKFSLTDVAIIQEVYKIINMLLQNLAPHIAVVAVNQFTKEGNTNALNGKLITPGDMHGGQVIQRYSDYDIAMTFTPEQKLANVRDIQTVKNREGAGFPRRGLDIDLSVSLFRERRE